MMKLEIDNNCYHMADSYYECMLYFLGNGEWLALVDNIFSYEPESTQIFNFASTFDWMKNI